MMPAFAEMVRSLNALLQAHDCRLAPTSTRVVFDSAKFGTPIFAIPDVHLCDGTGGDVFFHGRADKPRRLAAVLRAIYEYQRQHPMSSRVVQLGDWFDLWRLTGTDPRHMSYGAIQNVPAYREILELDAALGLAHVIGNHDAGFLDSLPDRRVAQPHLFRLGFWLGSNVYALHGHQTDIVPPRGAAFDETALHLATVMGRFIPGTSSFEAYLDRMGILPGLARWLLDAVHRVRDDPGPQPRAADPRALPAGVRSGSFMSREHRDQLARIAHQVGTLPESHGRSPEVVIVGHSHAPCAAWSDVTGKPIVLIDAGAWVYEQANLLLAADDTIAVFDVLPRN
jgi:hypothetical protein